MPTGVIYYACTLPVYAGGELVNFQHVASLRKQGWRAFALLDGGARVELPSRPFSVPLVHWGEHVVFSQEDWLVVPEVTSPQALARLASLPCRVVVHNQNPFYTFRGFSDIAQMNAYGLAGGLCCSHFTRQTLQRWGSSTDWQAVRPAVLPHFANAAKGVSKRRQIAFMPRKRPQEAAFLRQLFCGLFPQHAAVPWREISNMSRPQVAQTLAESLVFVSLSKDEGLGLPPLEAMAAGCLVCGFTGGGGAEYATAYNGLWVPEGDLEACARAIAACLILDNSAQQARVTASLATVAEFSEARFDAELDAAWRHLLAAEAPGYRTATAAGDVLVSVVAQEGGL
jgi:glycosyltransferase involved in cell wall biosynthesis